MNGEGHRGPLGTLARMSAPFGPVVTAMVTPFTADGALDCDGAATLARHLVANGSDGVVVAGTTGESPTLRHEEKLELFRAVVDAVGGDAAVVAGTSSYDTAASVALTEAAVVAGVDGVLAVTPYYSRPPQRGLELHFRAIADASDVPVLLYDIPGRAGTAIDLVTYEALCGHDRIVGVKDATGSVAHAAQVRAVCGEDFVVYSGDDALTLPFLSVGACGVVSVASHIAGNRIAAMIAAFAAGDTTGALALHMSMLDLFDVLFADSSPIPVKAAVALAGLPAGPTRPPLVPPTDELTTALRRVVEAHLAVQSAVPQTAD